jgi:hypothetical protein
VYGYFLDKSLHGGILQYLGLSILFPSRIENQKQIKGEGAYSFYEPFFEAVTTVFEIHCYFFCEESAFA